MPLMQAIREPDQNTIAPKTINSHIQMFKVFFDWAERHGYAPHKLFEGMKVAKAKNSEHKPSHHTTGGVCAVLPERVHMYRGMSVTGIVGDEVYHDAARGFAGGYYLKFFGPAVHGRVP